MHPPLQPPRSGLIRCLVFAILFSLPSALIAAEELGAVLMTSGRPFTAGQPESVWLYLFNDSSKDITWTAPPSLKGTLSVGVQSTAVSLALNNPDPGPKIVAPGAFVKQPYAFNVPTNVLGDAVLSVPGFPSIVIRVEGPAPAEVSKNLPSPTRADRVKKSTGEEIVGFLGDHLSTYEPIFFLLGTYPAAEFQFSMKFKVFNTEGPINPLAHFYFAYTQTSFWDLLTRDPSFFDTSYKPSAFLVYTNVLPPSIFNLDLQGGAEHESNGRGGTGERSLYTAYIQPTAHIDLPGHFRFALQPRVWSLLSVGANNVDLPDYRGYADLRTSLTWFFDEEGRRIQLADQLRIGDAGRHPGIWIDLRFDLPKWAKINPTIQLQYFTGYGQTLRQYNEYSHGFRAGLCLHY